MSTEGLTITEKSGGPVIMLAYIVLLLRPLPEGAWQAERQAKTTNPDTGKTRMRLTYNPLRTKI
jgi:hypothetical protein